MEGLARWQLFAVALTLLVLAGSCTFVVDEDLLNIPHEEIVAHVSSLLPPRPGSMVNYNDLPLERPPVFWQCDYSCIKTLKIIQDQGGVFTLDMT